METLKIKNFLCIEEAEIELNKLNLFIGPQAQGKSILAKLIYFFKDYPESVFEAILEDKTKSEFEKNSLVKFGMMFPKYTWEKTEFKITYSNVHYSISISNEKLNNGRFTLKLINSERVNKSFLTTRKIYKKLIQEESDSKALRLSRKSYGLLRECLIDNLLMESERKNIEQTFYIPAGRSFFATLHKNVFSFISSNLEIDFMLKEFGSIYERTKNENYIKYAEEKRPKSIDNIINKLISGKFISEKGQDWIINKHGKVKVSDSSSGQQEALPLAMILSTWPYFEHNLISRYFIIEEPEAHLFPVAQSLITSLIASAYNGSERSNKFVITTHSPYILTAFNNLIQAGNVAASKNYQNLEELYKVVPESEIVDFNDVSAYLVNNGTVQSILDNELKLIDATMIDSVSRQFANTFEQLVIMENECD
jgi:predicted ATPase